MASKLTSTVGSGTFGACAYAEFAPELQMPIKPFAAWVQTQHGAYIKHLRSGHEGEFTGLNFTRVMPLAPVTKSYAVTTIRHGGMHP
jgi:hypothetical protein